MSLKFTKSRLAVAVTAVCLCSAAAASAMSGPAGRPCVFGAGPPACFGPADFAQAYDVPAGLDGTGQTIVILTPYGDPALETDLALFDSYFGLPAPPSLSVLPVAGSGVPGSGQLRFWALETALDVEYAHAMAPGAKIVVAQAATDDNGDIVLAAAKLLPQYPGAVVSMSFGDHETDSTAGPFVTQLHAIFLHATALRETLVAASGDLGATFSPFTGLNTPVASYPASDPLVTGVGGTMGLPAPSSLLVNGSYGGEQVWNEPRGASGGAPSVLFPAPPWQRQATDSRMRTVPDVAYNAESAGGATVFALGRPALVGGTSLGSPSWAGIFALVNQARASMGRGPIGLANPSLYKLGRKGSGFHDITVGNNAYLSPTGFNATPGYDLATGWGTPDVAKLVAGLAKAPAGENHDGEQVQFPRSEDQNGEQGNGQQGNSRQGNGQQGNGQQDHQSHTVSGGNANGGDANGG